MMYNVKTIDYQEVERMLERAGKAEDEINDYIDSLEPNNDSASVWYVEDVKTFEEGSCEYIINQYFLNNGCQLNERVFIWFCW